MKKKKVIINKIIIAFILFMNLLLSIVNAENYNTADFNVIFKEEPKVWDSDKVVAKILDGHTAMIEVKGLQKVGDIGKVEFTLQNVSAQLDADLLMKTTNTNAEFFLVKAELEKSKLNNNEKANLNVSVELIKAPINGPVRTDIRIEFLAKPIYDSKDVNANANENIKEPPTKVQDVVDEIKEFIPNTGDNILVYIIFFVVLVVILIVITIIKNTLKEE